MMKKIKTIALGALLLSTTAIQAENHMLIMGGGGEPQGPDTIFDSTMRSFGENLKSTNWKYQMSFNGGHANTEAMMATQYPKPVSPITPFTKASYAKMISDYKTKIIKGEIKSGDQLIIMVNTHGAASAGDGKTHQISVTGGTGSATADLNNLKGTENVSLDALEELVTLTNQKGIKLGIVDLSCHSGNTLALKKNAPNTCIVTATGPKHYGFAGDTAFTGKFAQNLKKGETLESAFLKARTESSDASFPMISTDENDQIVAEVYAAITPYLYYYDPKADKISDYLMDNSADCVTCKRDVQFKTLMDKINQLQAASKGNKVGFNGEELKKLLIEYKAGQDSIINQQRALGVAMLDKKEFFVTQATSTIKSKGKAVTETFKHNMTWEEIINANPDDVIKNISKDTLSKDPPTQARTLAAIQAWKQIRTKQTELLFQYPQLKEAREQGKRIAVSIGENRAVAEKIAIQERKFYDELYRQKQSLNTDDPCRRIVF